MLLLLAGNCLPFHQPMCPTTKDPKRALVLSWFLITLFRWGFVLLFPGGPTTDHPCLLPASPDASDASDVIRYRPSQVTQDYRRTRNHYLCLAQTISGLEGLSVAWLHYGASSCTFQCGSGVTLTPSRMVMLLRHWAL